MKHDVQQEIELRRYLLGELPLEEQVLVEQRLFLDSDYAELLQAVEDELIDDYLGDELVGSEREKFKNHFLLLPEHGADLKIAQALKNYLTNGSSPKTDANNTNDSSPTVLPFSFLNKPFVWLSLTIAALIILAFVTWLAIRATRGPAADAPQQAHDPQPGSPRPDEQRQPSPLPNNDNRQATAEKGNTNGSGIKLENLKKPPERRVPHTQIATYALVAGGSPRSASSKNMVVIASGTTAVEFRLPLELAEPYEKYRAELLRGERKIDELSDLKSEPDEKYGVVVSVTFPVDLFREQRYRIKLYGIPADHQSTEPPSTYPFYVSRK